MATIPTALRPRLSRKAVASLLVAALGVPLIAGAGWVAFSGTDVLGEMELSAVQDVTVLRGGEVMSVDKTFELEPLDVISTGGGRSSAKFNLAGARRFELPANSAAQVVSPSAIGLQEGKVLANTSASTRVLVGDIEVTAPNSDALFRLDRMSSVRTGVYQGSVDISSPGEGSLHIPRYFQASVAVLAPNVPSKAAPYSLSERDPWDEDHLGKILDLNRDLTLTGRGLAGEFSGKPSLAYFSEVANTDAGFMKPYLKHRPADLLIGLTVAKGIKSMRLAPAFRKTLDLFERGASWGIAAAIMRAKPKTLLASLGNLIAKSGLAGGKSGAAAALALSTGATGPGTSEGIPGPTTDPTTPPNDDPTEGPGPGPSPSPSPSPSPTATNPPPECDTDAECLIEDIEPPIDNPFDDDLDKQLSGGGGGLGVGDL